MSKHTPPNIYTILTENKNKKDVEKILDNWFAGYNIQEINGRFNGKNEASLKIEIIGQDEGAVEIVCKEIKELNKQEQVWYLKQARQDVIIV
jgi:hypothetical protein